MFNTFFSKLSETLRSKEVRNKILFTLLPMKYRNVENFLSAYSFIVLIAFITLGWKYILPIIGFLYRVIVGAVF